MKECDKRAIKKYHTEKTKAYTVRFLKADDADIIEFLDSRSSKTDLFREAIRMIMKETQK